MKVTAEQAVQMELQGQGQFFTRGREIHFLANDNHVFVWLAPNKAQAETWLRSWRRVFSKKPGG